MEGALHSLSQLDLGYIDLYLVHWPGTQGLLVSDQHNPGKEVYDLVLLIITTTHHLIKCAFALQ